MTEKEYYPLDILDEALESKGDGEKSSTTITIQDASTETARVLVPQMGSDKEWLEEGKIDYRRFTHIDEIDPYWCAFFSLVPKEQGGGYSKDYVELYSNFMYSVNGRHKELTVHMQRAASGVDKGLMPKQKKKRSLTDRILGRNKDEEI
jgi:hypothetical protein